jgi:hypothetical protein
MAAKHTTITIDTALAMAYNAASKTQQKKARAAMRQALAEASGSQPAVPCLSPQETALFLRINAHLTPEQQQRYDALRTKREDETLAPAEQAELLQFIDILTELWADRLQALLELAQLRHVSPQQLMQQLAIAPRPHDV